ncbi:glutathione peroxidase [Paenibacillus sp. YYML68]|uniref:glutathione peroxidase n=1 Tax=Paenibacillus sp. YYML68 TaxID=2909250 RepID=UPI0024932485|nr:glutathione peroxidase [Paenibacillus sp. YYML68]
MSVYHYSAKTMAGKSVSLEDYKGKVLLIVNVASQCGFTYQYEDLQKLYDRYKDRGFVILGFPCNQFADQEPGTNDDVHTFCTLRYGVTFPMFQKVNVRDADAHPLFTYLASVKPFQGFNETHSVAKILFQLIREKHPEYMVGDSIKWNFTKFLIDREGNVVNRFESTTDLLDVEPHIEALL